MTMSGSLWCYVDGKRFAPEVGSVYIAILSQIDHYNGLSNCCISDRRVSQAANRDNYVVTKYDMRLLYNCVLPD